MQTVFIHLSTCMFCVSCTENLEASESIKGYSTYGSLGQISSLYVYADYKLLMYIVQLLYMAFLISFF